MLQEDVEAADQADNCRKHNVACIARKRAVTRLKSIGVLV